MHEIKMKSGFFCMCLVFCAALLLGACATSEDLGRMQWQLNELKKKTDSMEQRLPSGEEQFSGLKDSQKATAQSVSDLYIRTQELSKEVQRITGQFEEMQYHTDVRLQKTETGKEILIADVQDLKAAAEDLEKRLARLEGSPVTPQPEKKKDAIEKVEQKEEKPVKSEIKDAYMNAYESLKDGRATEAREQFMSFIRDYPENEYTDNARLWIAESHYKEKNYEDAILAYEELFRKNPDSDKVPGAMLKQGLAFYELKDKETGSLILEKLVEKFPDSEQAAIAKKKLKEAKPAKK